MKKMIVGIAVFVSIQAFAEDSRLCTAIHGAQVDSALQLIHNGINPNTVCWGDPTAQNLGGLSPLGLSAFYGYANIVDALIKAGADINFSKVYTKSTPLILASKFGHLDVVQSLIKAGAKLDLQNNEGDSALIFAAHARNGYGNAHDYFGIARALVNAGANLNLQGNNKQSALHEAIKRNFPLDTAFMLIQAGANINLHGYSGETPLSQAVYIGSVDLVKTLITLKADVNAEDDFGQTPIFSTIGPNHDSIRRLLLEAGAEINHKTKSGQNLLLTSVITGAPVTTIKELISEGSDFNVSIIFGTALLIATRQGRADTVSELVRNKANLDIVDKNGFSALMVAAENGDEEIVTILLANKANPTLRDVSGKSAFDYAVAGGFTSIARKIAEVGCTLNP